MPRFSEDWLDELKKATDIVEVVGRKVSLKQSGRNYTGLCPFHDEKTPSFSVNSEKQFYHCFGCGAGGDVIRFVMETENLAFAEAVMALAKEAGRPIPAISEQARRAQEERDILYKINHEAAQFFYKQLRASVGAKARQYLLGRDVTGELARRFLLGYASPRGNSLVERMDSQGFPLSQVEQAGLIVQGEQGYYDRFRDRIIFPILDHQGRFVGFGGRALGGVHPKYLNTTETKVFQKGKVLYGLNWAKDGIKHDDMIVLVEGYTDCIGLYAKGISNVVGSLGTSLTQHHADLLGRFSKHVTIAFDGDAAGRSATKRGLALLKRAGLHVRVAHLSEDQDPDSFSKSHTKGEVRDWLARAVPLAEHLVRDVVYHADLSSREGKVAACQEVVNVLVQMDSPVEREEYLQFAARLVSVDPNILRMELDKVGAKENGGNLPNAGNLSHITPQNRYTIKDLRNIDQDRQSTAVEKGVLRWLLKRPGLVRTAKEWGFRDSDFGNDEYAHLFRLLESGAWDKYGGTIADQLFSLKQPLGRFEEYLARFEVQVWLRSLEKIKEKLTSMTKDRESDIRLELCRLLQQYHGIRQAIRTRQEGGNRVEQ